MAETPREQERITINADLDTEVMMFVARGDTALQVAEKLASLARNMAPVDTGRYRDGIIAQKTPNGARVYASDNKSSWIEFGRPLHNVEPQFILRRCADILGLKFMKRTR
jgi:hypothetical protein